MGSCRAGRGLFPLVLLEWEGQDFAWEVGRSGAEVDAPGPVDVGADLEGVGQRLGSAGRVRCIVEDRGLFVVFADREAAHLELGELGRRRLPAQVADRVVGKGELLPEIVGDVSIGEGDEGQVVVGVVELTVVQDELEVVGVEARGRRVSCSEREGGGDDGGDADEQHLES